MKLFGNTKQSKYGKDAHRTLPTEAEIQSRLAEEPQEREEFPQIRHEQPKAAPQKTAERSDSATVKYDKKRSIFDYVDYEADERRQRMQEDYRATPVKERKKSKHKKRIRRLIALLIVLAILVSAYLFFCYSKIPAVAKFRKACIDYSMETMHFQWVALTFMPRDVMDQWRADKRAAQEAQIGQNSTEPPTKVTETVETEATEETQSQEDLEREAFYEIFWELDRDSAEDYFRQHPETLENGYSCININEAGLNDEGTTIYTTMGEQVLAIDAANEVLLVRVWCGSSRGVLAIAKDPSLLHLYPSKGIGGYGQHIADIASNHNGLVAITGSGFDDPGGNGSGGVTAGYCKCDGAEYGRHRGWGIKRIELKENNWLYINDAPNSCGDDVTDAVEFEPALVVNGKQLPINDYTANNPRCCLGQSRTGEILMIVVEGRLADSPGCSAALCAEKMMEHDCMTAMNLDGGTSAIMWYDGEVVTRCSNTRTPQGRYLPNAWVYTCKPVE